MLRRLLALGLLVWVLGVLLFSVTRPGPALPAPTDAVVALTGGEGRIEHALAVLSAGEARRMFVSGVDPEVKPREFAAQYHVSAARMACCVTLGYESVDTRSNGAEVARWAATTDTHSLRLVTSDWHMRRAAYELRRALPAGTAIVEDAVPTQPRFRTLFMEYNKLAVQRLLALWHRVA